MGEGFSCPSWGGYGGAVQTKGHGGGGGAGGRGGAAGRQARSMNTAAGAGGGAGAAGATQSAQASASGAQVSTAANPTQNVLNAVEAAAAKDSGGLLMIGDVRKHSNLSKEEFDKAAVAAYKAGKLNLHHSAVTPNADQKSRWIHDPSTGYWYLGMAPMRGG